MSLILFFIAERNCEDNGRAAVEDVKKKKKRREDRKMMNKISKKTN